MCSKLASGTGSRRCAKRIRSRGIVAERIRCRGATETITSSEPGIYDTCSWLASRCCTKPVVVTRGPRIHSRSSCGRSGNRLGAESCHSGRQGAKDGIHRARRSFIILDSEAVVH